MPLFTIGLDSESKTLLRSLSLPVGFDPETKEMLNRLTDAIANDNTNHFEEMKNLILNLEEKLMAEAQDFKNKIDRLTQEVAENKTFIEGLKDEIGALKGVIEAGASDKELADAARASVAKIDAAIAELDANTPAPPPPDEPPTEPPTEPTEG